MGNARTRVRRRPAARSVLASAIAVPPTVRTGVVGRAALSGPSTLSHMPDTDAPRPAERANDDQEPATDLLQPATAEEEQELAEGETELIFISPRRRDAQNEAGR
jgi:hypothetical protein